MRTFELGISRSRSRRLPQGRRRSHTKRTSLRHRFRVPKNRFSKRLQSANFRDFARIGDVRLRVGNSRSPRVSCRAFESVGQSPAFLPRSTLAVSRKNTSHRSLQTERQFVRFRMWIRSLTLEREGVFPFDPGAAKADSVFEKSPLPAVSSSIRSVLPSRFRSSLARSASTMGGIHFRLSRAVRVLLGLSTLQRRLFKALVRLTLEEAAVCLLTLVSERLRFDSRPHSRAHRTDANRFHFAKHDLGSLETLEISRFRARSPKRSRRLGQETPTFIARATSCRRTR